MSDADKLLAAYVDGVAELDADERKRVDALLASDATARADAEATRDLLGKLREMPPVGVEPSWSDLEAAIAREVGSSVPRRPWWRTWRWMIPTAALAATAAVAVILLISDRDPDPPASLAKTHDTPANIVAPAPESPTDVVWIDEQAVDLDSINADELLGSLADDIHHAMAGDDDTAATGLLPASDLGWIDNLDDKALDRAEKFLEHKKKS
jgi:hypothetical protein